MTEQPDTLTRELAQYAADALVSAHKKGNLTPEEMEKAKEAMRAGAVGIRRDHDGTFTVAIGAVAMVEGHISDLPSIAAEWEEWFHSS
ncbi:hypothetical protein [Streptomyces dysideae]|uniref:Uncharacterized protein n=1 Tax=Streptomyces dysideae TaxID=909626 RepID=A0A117S0T2_9ACTN|nr:hypothetical protein [Streptomyces dysideae]KUO19669.1 hypothetical protein AQJ91_17740 [Streptomyces dysideae]